jgi:hypothetical protein
LQAETTDEERAALFACVRQARLAGAHLEIGTAAGGTLKDLIALYPADGRPQFVVIDPLTYFPNQRDVIERNLSLAGIDPNTVDFRVAKSGSALRRALAAKERFSFIFIDAVHSADHVMQDLTWTRLLDVGGLVALHDHCAKFPGVIWAVRHFLSRQGNYTLVGQAGSLVVLKKIAPSKSPEVSLLDRFMAGLVAIPLHWRRMLQKRGILKAPTA